MITVPAGVRVLVATRPVDFRKGADGLVALVRETLRADPFSGVLVIFRSKRADRLKIVTWDGWNTVHSGGRRSATASCGCRRRKWPRYSTAWIGRGCTRAIWHGPRRRREPATD
jgi:transposase